MKLTHTFFALYFLATTTATMTAMQPSSTGILRESTFNNPARNINNNKLITFNTTPYEREYLKDEAYLQSLRNGNKEIKASMSKNACEHLVVMHFKQGFYEENAAVDTVEFTQEDKKLALAINKAQEQSRSKRRQAKLADKNLHREYNAAMTQESNFYDHATVDLLRVGLAVGCLYLVSGYFQNKK